jgi:hypothetical protein
MYLVDFAFWGFMDFGLGELAGAMGFSLVEKFEDHFW